MNVNIKCQPLLAAAPGVPTLQEASPTNYRKGDFHTGPAADDASCPTPEELLARVGNGDQEAFDQLYRVIVGPALGLARRVVRDEARAEEACQEAVVEVWRYAARFNPARGSALSWVMRITHRRAIDCVRSAQAAADRDHKIAIRGHQRAFDVVSDEVETRLEHEQVRRCLQALTPPQREVIRLAYYEGRTLREIAELLGTATGTVKSRLRAGMIRLGNAVKRT